MMHPPTATCAKKTRSDPPVTRVATGTHPLGITRPNPHPLDNVLPATKPTPARVYKNLPTPAPVRVFVLTRTRYRTHHE
jgi:hypothetical protein